MTACRAQMTMEFFFMISLAIVAVLVFSLLFGDMLGQQENTKKQIIITDYGQSIQNEFILAAEASPGYRRNFQVPAMLTEGVSFEINNSQKSLYLSYTLSGAAGDMEFPIPDTTGKIVKGTNLIENRNGYVCINC